LTVVVSSPQVPDPVSVRYAWPNYTTANLYNSFDLPASTFTSE
jgi:sialate O-acetylesterase